MAPVDARPFGLLCSLSFSSTHLKSSAVISSPVCSMCARLLSSSLSSASACRFCSSSRRLSSAFSPDSGFCFFLRSSCLRFRRFRRFCSSRYSFRRANAHFFLLWAVSTTLQWTKQLKVPDTCMFTSRGVKPTLVTQPSPPSNKRRFPSSVSLPDERDSPRLLFLEDI